MNEDKKNRLEEAGFQVGSVADFLQLSPEEQDRIEKLVVHEKTVKSNLMTYVLWAGFSWLVEL